MEMFASYPDVMTVDQMQDALQIGRSWAYRLIKSGEVSHFNVGKTIRILREDLIRYVRGEKSVVESPCTKVRSIGLSPRKE